MAAYNEVTGELSYISGSQTVTLLITGVDMGRKICSVYYKGRYVDDIPPGIYSLIKSLVFKD